MHAIFLSPSKYLALHQAQPSLDYPKSNCPRLVQYISTLGPAVNSSLESELDTLFRTPTLSDTPSPSPSLLPILLLSHTQSLMDLSTHSPGGLSLIGAPDTLHLQLRILPMCTASLSAPFQYRKTGLHRGQES